MAIAALLAILLRVNLIISVAMVWTTNPITMPPIYYFCYRVGTMLLGTKERVPFQLTLEWFWHELGSIWQPLLLGCLVVGTIVAALAFLTVHLLWRLFVIRAYQQRHQRRPRSPD